MTKKQQFLAAALAVALGLPALPAMAKSHTALAALDGDNDGTVDLAEVQKGAEAVFAKLEKDSDGTLEWKEVGSRLSKKDFAAADPDNDKTLTKDEYLALVEKRFKTADPDGEGTLDAKELRSKAGQAVLRLVR